MQTTTSKLSDETIAIFIGVTTALITATFVVLSNMSDADASVRGVAVETHAPEAAPTPPAPPTSSIAPDDSPSSVPVGPEAPAAALPITPESLPRPVAPVHPAPAAAPEPKPEPAAQDADLAPDTSPATMETPPEKTAPPVSAPVTPESTLPSNRIAENMRLDSPSLNFSAKFPPGSRALPAYRNLMQQMSNYRDRMRIDSKAEMDSLEGRNFAFVPWEIDIEYVEIAHVDNVLSIIGREYASTGGAHPNLNWDGLIANAETGEEIAITQLFTPRSANSPAFAIGVCEALKAARIGEASINGEPIDCLGGDVKSRFERAEMALAASTVRGKFGGVTVLFAPYDVGAYAEGPYVLNVPQAVFHEDLRPNYKAMFAGEPLPAE